MPTATALLERLESFDWDAWQQQLGDVLSPIGRDVVVASGARVLDTFQFDDPFVTEWFTGYVGERIVQLNTFTKADVSALIQRVVSENGALSTMELQQLVRDEVRKKFDGYKTWRAARIARTETGGLYNVGAALGAKQAGFTHVDITDGDKDEPCASANGAVWTIEQLLDNPLGHPNCTRAASPHVD
jgi:hypothetical protein